MEQLIIRYAIPGLPLAIVLSLGERFQTNTESTILDLAFLLVVAVLLGNLIQQGWMLVFESQRWGLAYNSEKRRVLVQLTKLLQDGKQMSAAELYARWETKLYSGEVAEDIRAKDRDTWHFYHAHMANSIGFALAALLAAVLVFQLDDQRALFVVIVVVSLISSFLLSRKALQTRDLVEALEDHWVGEWFGGGSETSKSA